MGSKAKVEGGGGLLDMLTCLVETMEVDMYVQGLGYKNIKDRGLSGNMAIGLQYSSRWT